MIENREVVFTEEIQKKLELKELNYTDESLRRSYNGIYNRYFKRLLDIIISAFGILAASPVMLIIAIAIAVETGFPVLYKPERGGYKNKNFRIFKFRTMVKNADKIGGGTTALNDSRITKVGALLRKTKLDELPQLLNVFLGNMSFIGPRPELLRYTDAYKGIDKNILNVRPGITDYSSINFINLDEIVGHENADEMYEKYVLKKKNQLRLEYVATVSAKTDFKLFWSTVGHVFKKIFRMLKRKNNGIHKS